MNSPLVYSIAEVCAVARISRTSIYQAIHSGELIARKHGRRTVILANDLHRWLHNLPVTAPKAASKLPNAASHLDASAA